MDDLALAQALQAGASDAMEALLRRYGSLLRYVVGGILRHPEETEDCLNEVCLQLWQKAGQYDPEKGSLSAWLTAIARNMAINRLKTLRRDAALQSEAEPVSAVTPETEVLRRERLERLRHLVERLPEVDRQLFYRKYYYVQPMAQIAAEMGLSLRSAEGRLYRLRKLLQRELGGDGL